MEYGICCSRRSKRWQKNLGITRRDKKKPDTKAEGEEGVSGLLLQPEVSGSNEKAVLIITFHEFDKIRTSTFRYSTIT